MDYRHHLKRRSAKTLQDIVFVRGLNDDLFLVLRLARFIIISLFESEIQCSTDSEPDVTSCSSIGEHYLSQIFKIDCK